MKTRTWLPRGRSSSSTRALRGNSFPNGSAIGGRFAFGGRPENPEDWPTIIGVVKDVPHNGVEEKSGNPFIYQCSRAGDQAG